jgi:hypothetical protein
MIHVDPAHVASSPAPAGAAEPRALIERQLAVLTRLADIGMEIAEAAGRAAAEPAQEASGAAAGAGFRADPALAYTRTARAVRMTIALQVQLLKELAAFEKAAGEAAKARAERRRVGVQRLIDATLAESERLDGCSVRRLSIEARERLFDAEIDAEVQGLAFAEIVARICGDLGLPPERTAQIVTAAGGSLDPSPSGSSRRSGVPARRGRGSCGGRMDPRDESHDAKPEDTFLEWPPPPS